MPQRQTNGTTDVYNYIDLDDPPRWWMSLLGVGAATLMIAVIIAPWFVNFDFGGNESNSAANLEPTNTICQPDTSGLPDLLDPTLASWGRMCDWFLFPDAEDSSTP